ncbi:hypothetical protein A3C91_00760 [Candidatus Azambacteria bacterium RIFCSPHIGHO2_02_FULL_52_12]|uniref:DUF5671 domain-containing protein n=1 Tax=Candidatus Azambacteria bacterium RIFCSPLOWO2_01_FULL_46_25 TaxID=1797298 RepID=A0A1F5BTY3_9BACT|nr:MAG: hypothetical protein A3C91_00760 [Candidatus Azambacteria bacterium RIFCSPHIGHO2_02_FULL_52_12]OGD34055.1 MAG: hypothetical protein A2988_01040 [Candidatus Azambacteria bacterium RIFCSPLOWO2_01_FULL_46_25]OGD37806.1 MAG: hypothetical protein A2850_04380 [Candidatus Azambacteria bacterium RIFCSPHIGHO2_01_FULL_51_74]
MIRLVLFIVVCAFALVVAFGTFVVLYHFQRFRVRQNSHRGRILLFLAGSAVFIWVELSLAPTIPWADILDMIGRNQMSL